MEKTEKIEKVVGESESLPKEKKPAEPYSEEWLEELVDVIVPRDDSEKKSKVMRLTLNNKSIDVPRGEICKIPRKYKLLLDKRVAVRRYNDDYKEELAEALKDN